MPLESLEGIDGNAVGGFTIKSLDLEHNLFAPVVVFDCPTPEIKLDDLFSAENALVEQIGEKHRDRSIRAYELDDPELNALGPFPLLAAEPLEVVAGIHLT